VKHAEHLAVLEALNLPVALINSQYTYAWVNSCFGAAQGKKPEEIIGRTVRDLWGETFDKVIKDRLDRCFQGVEVRSKAWVPYPAHGPRYCEIVYSPYCPDVKSALSAIVVAYDTTDRKELEDQLKAHEERLERLVRERTEALRKSEGKFRTIYENATEGIFQIAPDGRCLSVNPAFARIHGYDTPEDFITEVVDIGSLHVEPERRREYIDLLHKEGRVRDFEFKIYRKDKTVTWVSVNARAVRDETGSVLYREGTVQDISQRKQAEEHILMQRDLALKLAGMCSLEKALPLCLDTALKVSQVESGGIYVKNRQTGDLELACSSGLSAAFEKTVSLVKVESAAYRVVMAGKPVYRLPRHEGTAPFRADVLAEGLLSTAAIPVLHNGEVIACINLASRTLGSLPLVASATLELIAMQLGTIFARIQAEHELREREEHFSLIFQSNPGAMLLTTMDGRCLDVNQSFIEIVGYPREEVLGKTTLELGLWLSKERREKTVAHVRKRGSLRNYETRVRTKDGELKDVLASVAVITRRGNEYLLTMFHDVTERKRAEMQLLIQRNLALDLAATSSLDEALSICLESAMQVSGMDCGSIHLTNPDTDDLELRVHKGLSEEFVHLVSLLKAHSKIWSLSTQRGKLAFLPAEQTNEAIRPHVLKEGIRFVIGVPVRYRGQVLARMNLGSRKGESGVLARPTLGLIASQLGNILVRVRAEQELEKDIEKRREAEEALAVKSRGLEEANAALRVLLKHREEDRNELQERLVSNVKQLVLPHVEKLKKSRLEPLQQVAVDLVEANLKEILSPFLNNLRSFNFTPRQIEIVALIKEGRTTKDIAESLGVSKEAIDTQRFLIRQKLGLNKEKVNLRSYLLSLA